VSSAPRVNPRWLLAEQDRGVVLVGPGVDIEILVEGPQHQARRLCELLADGADAASVARALDCSDGEAAALLGDIAERGALVAEPAEPPDEGCSLAAALRDGNPPALVWTADEALLLPPGIPAALAREALHRFACGLATTERLRAHAFEARAGRQTTWGDAPDPSALASACDRAHADPPGLIHVLDLTGGPDSQVAVDDLVVLDAGAPHRLGTILATIDAGELDGRTLVTAYRAVPSLRVIGHPDARHSRGSAPTRELAELKARAEAAERYALEDPDGLALVRARASELGDGVVAPSAIVAWSPRQLAAAGRADADPDPELLWAPMRTTRGEPRWAPAGAVLLAVDGPDGLALSGSGAAAHTDVARARDLALAELVERDAFMRTWLQRTARELIDRRSLPSPLDELLSTAEGAGMRAALVNLTLESWPVVLCVVHAEGRLHLGAACRPRAEAAASAAIEEVVAGLRLTPARSVAPIAPEAVRTPLDHFRLHQNPERLAEDAFLWSSPDQIGLAEVTQADPEADLADLLAPVGEACFAVFEGTRLRPFVVVRALVPGLVPIMFGHDQEPLGLARVREPLRTADGRAITGCLAPGDEVMMPHPFP
jgi:thiazole/oxazole-forming peptide maturase SagD family component